MGGPNDSVSSNKSATSAGKKNPPDEQKWHPGRQLCYHWKREHTFLADQVDLKTIAFNTQFHLEIEHCDMDRKEESMSVRPSTKGVCACCAALATGRPGLLIAARVLRRRLLTLQAARGIGVQQIQGDHREVHRAGGERIEHDRGRGAHVDS